MREARGILALPSRSLGSAVGALSSLFVAILFGWLYWGYPLDGMVISDGWYWYLYEMGDFRWPLPARQSGNLEAVLYTPDWSMLTTRRGLMPVLVMGIDHLVIGDKRVFSNLACIAVQLANLGLFGLVVSSLSGARWMFPVLVMAALYPFASGSHFWQHLILNNLAATFFLLSLVLFLRARRASHSWALAGLGIAGLLLFWFSIVTVDYAIFMSPLYLYLALYFENGGRSLFRFTWRASPYIFLGAGFVGLSVLAGMLFAGAAPTFLIYSSRFEELTEHMGIAGGLLIPLAVLANILLTYLSALWFNSLGLLLQPASFVWQGKAVLTESVWVPIGILVVVGSLLFLWGRAIRLQTHSGDGPSQPDQQPRFLMVLGLLWAVLAYLPFSTSFGYPRIVGLMADRVNIVAQWGVSLCVGVIIQQMADRMNRVSSRRRLAGYALGMAAASLLIANLYVQREYYVEDYRKERQVAELILTNPLFRPAGGLMPVVLLDRKAKLEFPRAQLLNAIGGKGTESRALGLVKFLAGRYFLQDPVTSGFHLNGIMMFGCCPNSAQVTFEGYARWLRLQSVPVYKRETPFFLEQGDEAYRIGYRDTEVWSKSFGAMRGTVYSKRAYRLLLVEIDESFFHLRGSLVYNVAPYHVSDLKES